MIEDNYQLTIKQYEREYVDFMRIEEFPDYNLEFFDIKTEESDAKGFGAIAQAKYNPNTGVHTLRVCKNLELKKYVIFHELTHILDTEMYACKNTERYMLLSGYTEYHASQVELMYLLGAKCISDTITDKNVDSVISTFPSNKTVSEYIHSKHQFVDDMMNRKGFPKDIETLNTTLGALYNYWGLRSICKFNVKGYVENLDNTAIIQVLPLDLFTVMNAFMDGWFDQTKVEMSFGLYSHAIFPVIMEKKLT